MKPIIFSVHGQDRLRERAISKTEVIKTIRMPDRIKPASGKVTRAMRRLNGKTLHVLYEEKKSVIVFITTYER